VNLTAQATAAHNAEFVAHEAPIHSASESNLLGINSSEWSYRTESNRLTPWLI